MDQHKIVAGYFAVMLAIDLSGVMDLYGQNFVRRMINMYRRRDPMTYYKKLKPFCKRVQSMLDETDVERLQTIQIPERTDMPWFSRTNTTTHQCCTTYSEGEKAIIDDIAAKVKSVYEKQIGKPLYVMKSNKPTIYVYHGNTSKHLWHVDPRNLDSIYNVIVCIKKVGNISPLQCRDKDGRAYSIDFEQGHAAIFNGGTTVHQVPPNNDPNSERTVLSLAFTSDAVLADKKDTSENMCTFIEGGNNKRNIILLCTRIYIANYIASKLSHTHSLTNRYVITFSTITIFLSKYMPLIDLHVFGSNRSSSLYHNVILLSIFCLVTTSVKGGPLFVSYFMLSDVLFPRGYVEYD